MRFIAVCAFLLPITSSAAEPPHVASTNKLSPAEEHAKLHLPPGFELQLVASEPDIHKPLNMNFDERGRLWLTDTVEYPFPATANRPGRDRVMILDDFAPDGKARKITTFAEGLNIPIGILPYKDGCIVHSIPSIWRLHDTDGDGKADKKELLYGPFGTRDTHGMVNSFTVGFDGWIYVCHGYLNDSTIKGTDGQELRMNSGNVFRMRPDGSHVEIFTRGQVNPFGLCWDPLGNLYSGDCHSMPLTQLLRGAYYQSFGKPNDGLGFAPHMIDFGTEHSTALCGVVFYDADQFPPEYKGRMFLGDVVWTRLNVYQIDYAGSSPRATFGKFLTSDDPWFRPVDIKLGPDGAIYLADFYNKIIGHYEVPLTHPGRDRDSGRIWRIVWKGLDGKAPPPQRPYGDLRKESVEKLVELMGHANLTVRLQATNELVERGEAAKEPTKAAMNSESASRRIHALWVLERIGALDDKLIKRALDDDDIGVRVHLARILAERKDISQQQRKWLIESLEFQVRDETNLLPRCAADALGRHPSAESLDGLLMNWPGPRDTHRVQVFRMALRDHIKAGLLWNRSSGTALFSRQITEAIHGAPSPEAAEFLLKLKDFAVSPADIEFIARYGRDETVAKLIRDLQKYATKNQIERFLALHRGTQARGETLPKPALEWAEKLTDELLESREASLREAGAELIGSTRLKSKEGKLLDVVAGSIHPFEPRAAACAALVVLDPVKHLPVLGRILRDPAEPAGMRERIARTLGTLNRAEARTQLVDSFSAVPAALALNIAMGLAATPPGSEALLTAVADGKASPRLLQEKPVQVLLRQHPLRNLDQRLAKLTAGIPPADEKINELIRTRLVGFNKSKGDAAEGAKVYTKHCAACHQLGGQGSKVGPQLDGIGARSAERLLEDILDPNRNVDPAFRSTRITLKDGRDVQGLVLREEGEVVVLADNQGKELRVEKKQIEERVTTPLSPMPANWAEIIPAEDLNHLLTFLLSRKAKP